MIVVDVEDRDDSAWRELTPFKGRPVRLEAPLGPDLPHPEPAVGFPCILLMVQFTLPQPRSSSNPFYY